MMRRFEFVNEFFDGVGVDNGYVFSFVFEELVDFGDGVVEGVDGEIVVCYVYDKVLFFICDG